jgi:hypothetical protein
MATESTLAFVSGSDLIERLASDVSVLPLSPRLLPLRAKVIEKRPEDLLSADAEAEIEARTTVAVRDWWGAAPRSSFDWRGWNFAECFEYDLRFVFQDLFKTEFVIDQALERTKPDQVVTDVMPLRGRFPPYPYLSAIGSLLVARAATARWDLQRPIGHEAGPRSRRPSILGKGYLSWAVRQGLSRLREENSIVALGPYRDVYQPLAKAADRGGNRIIAVTSARAPIRASSASGLFVLPVTAFLESADQSELKSALDRARQAVLSMPLPAVVGPKDRGLDGAIRGHLLARLTEEIPDLIGLSIAFDRGLGSCRKALLMETASPLAKAFVRQARSRGITVTVLQHGIVAGAFSYRATEGDRVAAWGAADATWFRAHLERSVRTEATGNPKYDTLVRSRDRLETNPGRSTRGPPWKILLASQPFVQDRPSRSPWDRAAALEMAIRGTLEVPGVQLIIKWHPAESGETWSAKFPRGRVRVARRGSPIPLIREASVVLVISSTIALEAMLLGRPVVFLGPPDPDSPFHPPEDGGGIRIRSARELSSVVSHLIQDPTDREKVLEGQEVFLQEHYASLDGRAAERLAEFLLSG